MKDKKGLIGLSFALNGLRLVIKTERNFRIHLVAAFIVIIFGFIFHLHYIEWAIIFLVIGLVFATEMINSVIEKMLDYLNPKIHPQAKVIKDMAAGAVLSATIMAVIIGVIIFLPKIIERAT